MAMSEIKLDRFISVLQGAVDNMAENPFVVKADSIYIGDGSEFDSLLVVMSLLDVEAATGKAELLDKISNSDINKLTVSELYKIIGGY